MHRIDDSLMQKTFGSNSRRLLSVFVTVALLMVLLELRDWLLRLAILLFVLDVAVRRIQIDQAEWLRATQMLRRWLPWRTAPRPKDADESLSALLSRRDEGQQRIEVPRQARRTKK